MKVTAVTVEYSRLLNLGDYNNVRLEAGISADIEEGEMPEEALRELTATVREAVREALLEVARKKGQMVPVDLIYQMGGLPVHSAESGVGSAE